ncbi:MAG: hypothetical protein JW990_22020 [Thermoleophilia bacterium]|nr:hypothetical protein [Thermoleophilia bacterium]
MTLVKRIDEVEDHTLTPREAVICWMREAHTFDSLLDYGRWLLDQPEEAYPLIKMPAQVVGAVRARHKGMRDDALRDQLYRAQRDVLFLFHLHKCLNVRVLEGQEVRRLGLELLGEKLRILIYRIYSADRERLDRFERSEHPGRPRSRRKKTPEELAVEKEILAWPMQEALLWTEVTSLMEAERLLAKRYLSGESLLYPGSAQGLEEILSSLARLRETYDRVLDGRPPDSDDEFARWLYEEGPAPRAAISSAPTDASLLRPGTRRCARAYAEHCILVARAEALEALGERDAGIRLVEEWMRSEQAQPVS